LSNTVQTGHKFERYALQHLNQAGLVSITTNWSCRYGEIDLIMLDQDTVVFIEVRYRKHQDFGGALDSVDQRKRNKLIKTAECFLNEFPQWLEHPCRFDVISVHPSSMHTFELDWIQDAFES